MIVSHNLLKEETMSNGMQMDSVFDLCWDSMADYWMTIHLESYTHASVEFYQTIAKYHNLNTQIALTF